MRAGGGGGGGGEGGEVVAHPLLTSEMLGTSSFCRNRLPEPSVDASKVEGGVNPGATVTCSPPLAQLCSHHFAPFCIITLHTS